MPNSKTKIVNRKHRPERSEGSKIRNPKSKIPLIVLVNDDGIKSPGIKAMARALMDLGEVLIVAPLEQQTSTGRSFRGGGVAKPVHFEIEGQHIRAFAVAATPAPAVRYAVLIHADRPPALVVSGINYGENVGDGVTISGTIGAALEAASMGVPALAVSKSVHAKYHFSHSAKIEFEVAAEWGKRFAKTIIERGMPHGADVVNLNIPDDATLSTPWYWTHTSRKNYYRSKIRTTTRGKSIVGYEQILDQITPEPNSDIRAVMIDHVVSVSCLTLDLTARVAKQELKRWGR